MSVKISGENAGKITWKVENYMEGTWGVYAIVSEFAGAKRVSEMGKIDPVYISHDPQGFCDFAVAIKNELEKK